MVTNYETDTHCKYSKEIFGHAMIRKQHAGNKRCTRAHQTICNKGEKKGQRKTITRLKKKKGKDVWSCSKAVEERRPETRPPPPVAFCRGSWPSSLPVPACSMIPWYRSRRVLPPERVVLFSELFRIRQLRVRSMYGSMLIFASCVRLRSALFFFFFLFFYPPADGEK